MNRILDTEAVRLEQQVGQQRGRLHLVGQFDEHAERQRVVNHRLPDVEDAHAASREDPRERVRDAWVVVTGDVDVEDA
ncbi:MAG: hypothetical protein QM736_29505 [Vicinamibacterales bacterium]